MLLGDSATLQLVGIVLPTVTVLIGILGLYAAFHPHLKERREERQRLQSAAERLENAADMLFGREGDPVRGLLPIKGVLQRLDEQDAQLAMIKSALGVNDGVRPAKSILEMLDAATSESTRLRADITEIKRRLNLEGGNSGGRT